MNMTFRRQQEIPQLSAQHIVAKPEKRIERLTVSGSGKGPASIVESALTKAMAATMSNEENLFLKLPQEIHNAIFSRLVDQTNASRTSFVDHAGMYDASADKNTRHIQCSTPTLRALLSIVYSCRQLYSEFEGILSDFRSKTLHQFRILDVEDVHAFQSFFRYPNEMHHRLTPHLKISLPTESANLKAVLVTMATLPDKLLKSLALELFSPGQHELERPEIFIGLVDKHNRILQCGSMVCTRLSHRVFDGLWTLRYQSVTDLTEGQKNAWVGAGLSWAMDHCRWQDGYDEGTDAAILERRGVREWNRSLERATMREGRTKNKDGTM